MSLWSSRWGFLLAAVGAAVGIGNIWRFSAVLGQNGGGAYLIPYLVSVIAFAVPLMVLELAAGRHYRATVVGAFQRVGARLRLAGWVIYTIVFVILSYYLVITGWTLAFLLFAVAGTEETFATFTDSLLPYPFFLIAALATGLTVALGVRHGIERLTRYVMPLAFVLLIALAIRSLALEGAGEALRFMFRPDFGVWSNVSIWGAAIGQAFFSLSVGFGVLLAYGAYLHDDVRLVPSAWLIAAADLLVAVLAGIVIFPIVFSFGLSPTMGAELAFTTLPLGFGVMSGGRIVAIAFFLLIFLAALTSAVSMLEANVAAVRETTGKGRRATAGLLTLAVVALGTPSALSYTSARWSLFDAPVLDFLDDTLGTLGLPIAALTIAFAFVWLERTEWLRAQTGLSAAHLRALRGLLRYVIPAALVFVTASRLAGSVGFEGWHTLPNLNPLGILTRDLGIVLTLAVLVPATLTVVWAWRRIGIRRAFPMPPPREREEDAGE